MKSPSRILATVVAMAALLSVCQGFQVASPLTGQHRLVPSRQAWALYMSDDKQDDCVVELASSSEEEKEKAEQTPERSPTLFPPFLSQGELDEDALNPDLSDAKQARVIIYILISLVPVLFLIPLMLGSRDLIPLDALPPVDL